MLTIVACSAPREVPSPSATVDTQPPVVSTQPPVPPPAPEANIYIDSVEVANPVVITGRARTFENSVALRVFDARGNVIGESFTTSTGEMGQHNPFRGTVWITSDPGRTITAEALEYSAKDGSPQSIARVQKPFNVELIDAQLAFGTEACDNTVTSTRRMPKSLSHARLLVEALLRGPDLAERQQGLTSPFPQGSAVQSVNLRNGVLTVDFNERLRNVGGSCPALMIRRTVTETLGRLPSVKRVVITAGGSEKLALQP
jgi:hypothetical protein